VLLGNAIKDQFTLIYLSCLPYGDQYCKTAPHTLLGKFMSDTFAWKIHELIVCLEDS